jgi:hypothetical protein
MHHIKDLHFDKKNARKHNPRNIGMIERSLNEVGAARSIVIDENNNILAGNGTIEAAQQAGINNVHIVEADGNTIVAVKRTGLTDEQKKKLALYDNRTAELADWDAEIIQELQTEIDLSSVFTDKELNDIGLNIEGEVSFTLPDGDKAPFQQMTFTLADEQAVLIQNSIADIKKTDLYKYAETMGNENSNGNALYLIVSEWARQKK